MSTQEFTREVESATADAQHFGAFTWYQTAETAPYGILASGDDFLIAYTMPAEGKLPNRIVIPTPIVVCSALDLALAFCRSALKQEGCDA